MMNISASLPLLTSSTGKEFLKEQGNIKPEQLYKIIVFDNRKPDFLAIDLYSDIRSWYKPKKTTEKNGKISYASKLSKISQLKRRIATTFERQTTYKLLVSCYFNEIADKSKFEIKKRANIEITEFVKNKLLNEVRGVYGEQIEELVLS